MRPLLLAALLLSACAGRDTPADAWVFRDQKQKPGDPSLIEAVEDDYNADPVGTAHAVGSILGAIGVVVLKIVAR